MLDYLFAKHELKRGIRQWKTLTGIQKRLPVHWLDIRIQPTRQIKRPGAQLQLMDAVGLHVSGDDRGRPKAMSGADSEIPGVVPGPCPDILAEKAQKSEGCQGDTGFGCDSLQFDMLRGSRGFERGHIRLSEGTLEDLREAGLILRQE